MMDISRTLNELKHRMVTLAELLEVFSTNLKNINEEINRLEEGIKTIGTVYSLNCDDIRAEKNSRNLYNEYPNLFS